MTTAKPPDLEILLLPILRRCDIPMSCVELGRLTGQDSSAVFRCLSNHPAVVTSRGTALTTFSLKGGA